MSLCVKVQLKQMKKYSQNRFTHTCNYRQLTCDCQVWSLVYQQFVMLVTVTVQCSHLHGNKTSLRIHRLVLDVN